MDQWNSHILSQTLLKESNEIIGEMARILRHFMHPDSNLWVNKRKSLDRTLTVYYYWWLRGEMSYHKYDVYIWLFCQKSWAYKWSELIQFWPCISNYDIYNFKRQINEAKWWYVLILILLYGYRITSTIWPFLSFCLFLFSSLCLYNFCLFDIYIPYYDHVPQVR